MMYQICKSVCLEEGLFWVTIAWTNELIYAETILEALRETYPDWELKIKKDPES